MREFHDGKGRKFPSNGTHDHHSLGTVHMGQRNGWGIPKRGSIEKNHWD